MKSRFSTIDIIAEISDLQKYVGMRVNQVYDIDTKTYLIRLNRYEEKVVLLIESGMRIHTTDYQWPKNPSPSGFSMKMRKHIKNKRLESISQLGTDRIVDMQFGINEAAYHVILELYDRGNVVFTDFEYTILNILRPRASGCEDVKFIVRERYPVENAKSYEDSFKKQDIYTALESVKEGESLKKVLMPLVSFGPALLDHVLAKNGFPRNCSINKNFNVPADINRLFLCLEEADSLMKEIKNNPVGYIIHKVEKNNKDGCEIVTNTEFHPYLFYQFQDQKYTKYDSFDKAVDNFFSNMEGQKIDLKAFQKEKEALKKLENVKKDHEQRLVKLHDSQALDIEKAQLIESNLELVDKALLVIRSAVANQISWSDIQDLIKEAQLEGDLVAKAIKKLKLDINHFTLLLSDPHKDSDDEESKPVLVDIDLDLSAYANARKYYDKKRAHAKKEQKTIESSEKAFKSAEKKTKQVLKEVAVTKSITKARKVMWFEKFLWFISSENYLVIAGRDVQQNELLVKRYLKSNDLYVHADMHGASSVVIKNTTGGEIPPKTLNEAGTMAVCYSSAWDAKIVTSAWWVHSNQVSKTAPSGEYLTTGSFMIRGKKNFLTPAPLIMGFGFMFKLDEESFNNHVNERSLKIDESQFNDENSTKSDTVSVDPSDEDENGDKTEDDEEESVTKNKVTDKELSDCEEADEDNATNGITVEKELNVSEESDSSQSETINFPDTEVKLDVYADANKTEISKKKKMQSASKEVIIQQHKKKVQLTAEKEEKNASLNATNDAPATKEKQGPLKRGQKGKLKKIREKYKYQDEEERALRMKILASAGPSKEDKKSKKKNKLREPVFKTNQPKKPKQSVKFIEILEDEMPDSKNDDKSNEVDHNEKTTQKLNQDTLNNKEEIDEVSDEEEETQISDELQVLNSLTGCPVSDDTLLYAVPVCAPYTCMHSYKYKVKVVPGSNRRGKAAKTALQIFMHEKTASLREKDLLRSVKDQDFARNLPGRIKISTTNYKKTK